MASYIGHIIQMANFLAIPESKMFTIQNAKSKVTHLIVLYEALLAALSLIQKMGTISMGFIL